MWKKSDEKEVSVAQHNTSPGASSGVNRAPGQSLIGSSLWIKGELGGEEDIRIEGKVEGTITLPQNSVTIEARGEVLGDIHARAVFVKGHLEGDVFGSELVTVHTSGNVRGDITAPEVSLEGGAKLKGTIDMDPKPAKESMQKARAIETSALSDSSKESTPSVFST